ncbi:hypothetical protein DVH24_032172 [Malus domestica]|uniref:Uncharacterized protein n=1 Tax=Malus domestica TaxID=3750 RepID=A0A498J531_MALDO|nr:hypothetical protein DVH24_032172 [Malus domestica]
MGLLGASPRNRRSWRRSENETREEKVLGLVEEVVKPRKRRSKKEKLDLVLSLPSPSTLSSKSQLEIALFSFFRSLVLVFSLFGFAVNDEYQGNLDRIGQLMTDLIMWRDLIKKHLILTNSIISSFSQDFPNRTFDFGCFICLQFNLSKVLVVSLSATIFFVSGGLHLYPMLILLFQLNSGEPSMTLKVMANKTLRQRLNSKLLALGSSVLSYGSRVWASYNILEAMYAWYAQLLISRLCC